MRICQKCNEEFEGKCTINGKKRDIYHRNYCLTCYPLASISDEKLTNIQEQILNGHLLGDGGITKGNKNSSFGITRKDTDKNYILWTVKNFENFIYSTGVNYNQTLDKRSNKIYSSVYFQTKVHPIFTEYRKKWYPEDKKIVPKDLILTPLTIAVWFADDGFLFQSSRNNLRMTLATNGFRHEDVLHLQNQLVNMYGNKVKIREQTIGGFMILSYDTNTVSKIITDIYPVFPPLNRKLKILDNCDKIELNCKIDDYVMPDINFCEKIKLSH